MHDFIPVELTQQQRDNYETLLDVLESPERRQALAPDTGIAMSSFYADNHGYPCTGGLIASSDLVQCPTSACAAGWAFIAGIPAYADETWSEYCDRQFGAKPFDRSFDFPFGGSWPNSFDQAAARIRIMLRWGIPAYFDMDDDHVAMLTELRSQHTDTLDA